MFIISKKIFDYRGGGLELYNLFLINRAHHKLKNQNRKGGAIMKLLNKIYPLFVVWLGLFSSVNAQSKAVWFEYYANTNVLASLISTSIIKMNDTLYLVATSYSNNNDGYTYPLIIAIDSQLSIKWLKVFDIKTIIKDIVKINDTLIAVSSGYLGVFNISTKSFIWLKSINGNNGTLALFFDGQDLIVGGACQGFGFVSCLWKFDMNGNLIFSKQLITGLGGHLDHGIVDGLYDGENYVFINAMTGPGDSEGTQVWKIVVTKMNKNGSIIWSKMYHHYTLVGNPFSYMPFKILKDNDGYIIVGTQCVAYNSNSDLYFGYCATNARILAFKINFNGNVLWFKSYLSGVSRGFNANFDYDGNLLISGSRTSYGTVYPVVLKINKINGNLIWARYWDNVPQNSTLNESRGVISLGAGKFYVTAQLGSLPNIVRGFIIVREDTNPNLIGHCTKPINYSIIGGSYRVDNFPFIIVDTVYGILNLNVTPYYSNSIVINNVCEITPVNNPEVYFDCGIKIYSKKNYLEILANEEKFIRIYDIKGSLIYSRKVKGIEKVYLKGGIYIIRVNDKFTKILLRG